MQSVEHINIPAKDGAVVPVLTYNIENENKKGVVIICHGFGEHSGSYIDHARRLWQGGYASIVPDQRGHGVPPEGKKRWHGCIPDYKCFVDDVISVTEAIKEKMPDMPIALFGHSMGGNIVINTLLRITPKQAESYFCAIFESPWLELYKPLSPLMIYTIRILNRIAPNFRQRAKLNQSDVLSDREKSKSYSKDPHYHGFMSMRMIKGITDACSYALDNAAKLPVKSFLSYASNELIVSQRAILDFAAKAGDMVTAKEYESNHAIYNDVCCEDYCRDLIAFLDMKLKKYAVKWVSLHRATYLS